MADNKITVSEEIIEHITNRQRTAAASTVSEDIALDIEDKDGYKKFNDDAFYIKGPDGEIVDPGFSVNGMDSKMIDPGFYIDPKSM